MTCAPNGGDRRAGFLEVSRDGEEDPSGVGAVVGAVVIPPAKVVQVQNGVLGRPEVEPASQSPAGIALDTRIEIDDVQAGAS